eukprot:m.124691 g.124691  ORF g.124691 m.124691 type:complete len:150 (-) comp52186_c0_seq9:45-494(-)
MRARNHEEKQRQLQDPLLAPNRLVCDRGGLAHPGEPHVAAIAPRLPVNPLVLPNAWLSLQRRAPASPTRRHIDCLAPSSVSPEPNARIRATVAATSVVIIRHMIVAVKQTPLEQPQELTNFPVRTKTVRKRMHETTRITPNAALRANMM